MQNKKVAILQSNYLPWKGYFDLISYVDEFIIYDDAQYTKNSLRNRNLIVTRNGLLWLTVPIIIKGKHLQKINEAKILGNIWPIKHWKTILQNYGKSKFIDNVGLILNEAYFENKFEKLSDLNIFLIMKICKFLNINTKISNSKNYELIGNNNEKIVNLCLQSNSNIYVSGPMGKNYLDTKYFTKLGLKIEWFSYKNYPEYKQRFNEFHHNVSIIDLLFNYGNESKKYMKYI